jgi:hypothetical protein
MLKKNLTRNFIGDVEMEIWRCVDPRGPMNDLTPYPFPKPWRCPVSDVHGRVWMWQVNYGNVNLCPQNLRRNVSDSMDGHRFEVGLQFVCMTIVMRESG